MPEPVGKLCWVKVNHPYAAAQPNIEWNHAHRSKFKTFKTFKTHSERGDVNGVLGARVWRWLIICSTLRTGLAENRPRIQFNAQKAHAVGCEKYLKEEKVKNMTFLPVTPSQMS